MVLQMDPCSRFDRWLAPYVDGEVDAIHIMEVEDHLDRCEQCSERVAWLKAVRGSMRRVATVRAPSALRERVRAVLAEQSALDAGLGALGATGTDGHAVSDRDSRPPELRPPEIEWSSAIDSQEELFEAYEAELDEGRASVDEVRASTPDAGRASRPSVGRVSTPDAGRASRPSVGRVSTPAAARASTAEASRISTANASQDAEAHAELDAPLSVELDAANDADALPDRVALLPDSTDERHGRDGAARRKAQSSKVVQLRYLLPLAAAAAFALIVTGMWRGQQVLSVGDRLAETSQERASAPEGASDEGLLVAGDARRDSSGAQSRGARGVDDVERVAERDLQPPRESTPDRDATDPSLSSNPQKPGGRSDSDPLRVANAADAEPAWAGLGVPAGQIPRSTAFATLDSLIEDLVEQHAEPLPPETTDPSGLSHFDKFVGVRVARPRYEPFGARYLGARLHPVNGRRTAMLQYVVGGSHRVTLYVFDSQRVPMRARLLKPRQIESMPMYVGKLRGYSVAASENAGVGYALASDLPSDESAKLVLVAAKP